MPSKSELLTSSGLRIDGRKCGEIRNLRFRVGILPGVTGSSEVEMGTTRVQVCVFGPLEKPSGYNDKSFLNVKYKVSASATYEFKPSSSKSRQSEEMRVIIKRTFEPVILRENFERSILDIGVFVLQYDGGLLSAVLNAVTLALIDASIPISDYVCSCTAGLIQGNPAADLSLIEESSNIPSLTLAIMPRKSNIVTVEAQTAVDVEKLQQMVDLAFECCKTINLKIKSTISTSIQNLMLLGN